MIQLIRDNTKAQEFSVKILTDRGNYISVRTKISNWLVNNPIHPDRDIITFIESHLEKLIVSEPKELESYIIQMIANGYQNRIYDNGQNELSPIGRQIKEFFNYDGFRKSAKAIWLANTFKIKSCAYCNTQYTLKIEHGRNKKLLFHLDHFFPQSIYPYLSLSFYNLIPCCASCNMSKSNRPLSLDENIHPYQDSFDELAKYYAEPSSLTHYVLNPNKNEVKIRLQIVPRIKYVGDTKAENKISNYKNEFKLEALYGQFNDVVAETYLKALYYNSKRKKELVDFFKSYASIDLEEELINRFILGSYTEQKNLGKRPLSKMIRDIGIDMGLI